jgi:vacuolar-type H+-ATPase subunit E/Vma4
LDEKALKNIIHEIEKDANRKIEEYRKIADEKRQEILKKAKENLEKELRELRLRNEREIENMVNYIVSQAKIKGRRMILEERERGINSVFSQALEKASQDGRYRGFLERSVKKAKESLGSGTIVCRKSDESVVKAMLPPDFTLKAGLEEQDAGIVAISKDERRIVDMRVSRIVEDMREDLRKEVSNLLYGGAQQ